MPKIGSGVEVGRGVEVEAESEEGVGVSSGGACPSAGRLGVSRTVAAAILAGGVGGLISNPKVGREVGALMGRVTSSMIAVGGFHVFDKIGHTLVTIGRIFGSRLG